MERLATIPVSTELHTELYNLRENMEWNPTDKNVTHHNKAVYTKQKKKCISKSWQGGTASLFGETYNKIVES